MNSKLMSALGIARKSGNLIMGYDPVKESVLKDETDLVLVASDISEKTKKRVEFFCEDYVQIVDLPFTQYDLLQVTRKLTAVLAISDENLSILIKNNLK